MLRAWLVVSAVAAAVVPLVPVGIILYRHYRRIYGWTPWLAMVPRAVWLLAGTGLYFAVFTVLATVLFLIGTGLQGAYAHPFWQWWLYALYYSDDPVVHASGSNVSGVPAAILPLLAAGGFWYRRRQVPGSKFRRNPPPPERPVAPPIRSTTDNHGHARWALMPEAQELWPGPNPSFGGVVVGEAYDPREARGPFSPGNPATWGQGGRAPLLIDPCVEGSTHSLVDRGLGLVQDDERGLDFVDLDRLGRGARPGGRARADARSGAAADGASGFPPEPGPCGGMRVQCPRLDRYRLAAGGNRCQRGRRVGLRHADLDGCDRRILRVARQGAGDVPAGAFAVGPGFAARRARRCGPCGRVSPHPRAGCARSSTGSIRTRRARWRGASRDR